MQVLHIQQNSEEWLEFRLGKVSGSKQHDIYSRTAPSKALLIEYCQEKGIDYTKPTPTKADPNKRSEMTIDEIIGGLEVDGKVIGGLSNEDLGVVKARQDKKDGFYKLVAERVARPITPNDYVEQLNGRKFTMMERGHILEPQAIAAFTEKTGLAVENGDQIWQSDDDPNLMVSPDGAIKNNKGVITEAVEVKCPDSHVLIRAFDEQRYPDEYYEQVLQYFVVNPDLERLHFVMFTDVMPALPIQIFTIERATVAYDVAMLKTYSREVLQQVEALAERLAF